MLRLITDGNRLDTVYALLIQIIPAGGLEFLGELDLELLGDVFGELMFLAARGELKMSHNKSRVVGQYFSSRLTSDSLHPVVCGRGALGRRPHNV